MIRFISGLLIVLSVSVCGYGTLRFGVPFLAGQVTGLVVILLGRAITRR